MKESVILRPVTLDDCDGIRKLAKTAKVGMTTLPKEKKEITEKILNSQKSFSKGVTAPNGELYFFVMEKYPEREVIGTSTILSSVGCKDPFYAYDIKKEQFASPGLGIKNEISILKPSISKKGPSELGTLYIHPKFRGKGLGRFLSLSRFLFVATHLNRFKKTVLAEMRGVSDDNGISPFWNEVGKYFFQMEFDQADQLSAKNKTFIGKLLPKHPIYIHLLAQEAQNVIGKTHKLTLPALKLLEQEGFEFSGSVDIFDGGPKISCQTNKIRVVRETFKATIANIMFKPETQDSFLICNGRLQAFRVGCGQLKPINEGEVAVSKTIAQLLNVWDGDTVHFASLYPSTFVRRFSEWYKTAAILSKTNG